MKDQEKNLVKILLTIIQKLNIYRNLAKNIRL